MLKDLMLKSVIIAFACSISFVAYAIADSPRLVNVPAGDLIQGLESLAKQADVEFVYRPSQLGGLHTRGVSGSFTARDAVIKLLEGTKLQLRTDQATGAMLIAPSGQDGSGPSGASSGNPSDTTTNSGREGKKDSSDGFRVAQVDQVDQKKASSDSSVEEQDEQESKKKFVQLEEVVVTGSRIPIAAGNGAQEVKIYTRDQIDQSGQANIADFLSTLPDVSVAVNEANGGLKTAFFATTVQLHGLPLGATLVLVNGRRVQDSGTSVGKFFDLNNLPLAAVERVEVVSEGSSAVYGSDAIAGVVNIVLRKDFDGVEARATSGWASGTNEQDASLAWGERWDKGSLSIIGSVQNRSELPGADRALTATMDYRPYGGADGRLNTCNPGNVFSTDGSNLPGIGAPFAAVPPGFTGTPTQQTFARTAGTLNACSISQYLSVYPRARTESIMASGHYNVSSSVELFTELSFSNVQRTAWSSPPLLFAQAGFSQFTMSASNPYNPFGVPVGVGYEITSLGRVRSDQIDTEAYRPLIGLRGGLFESWHWEVAAWESREVTHDHQDGENTDAVQAALNSSDPATALNPFTTGSPGSAALLASFLSTTDQKLGGRTDVVNGYAHGPVVHLPSGPVEVLVGAESERASIDITNAVGTESIFHRRQYAVFGEVRIPIVENHDGPRAGDTLALSMAGRYDHYSDFGAATTPQYGLEWRPVESLLVRGSYSKAFKAPGLYDLYSPRDSFQEPVVDPLRGNQTTIASVTFGGNPNLRPERGESHSFGFVYQSREFPGFRVSLTRWVVDETSSIQSLLPETIVNNELLFPGQVIRAANCLGGPPCPITQVNAEKVNFGKIHVSGFDYAMSYEYQSRFGQWLPTVSVTQTDRFTSALTPGGSPTDRLSKANDDGVFAPRWKGTVALGWKLGPYSANVAGRYVGRYQDYDSTNSIGNFWLADANLRYGIGGAFMPNSQWLRGTYIAAGGVNLFNKLPQFSNYGFGGSGFDPAEADIRGRFLYIQLGAKW